jgi:REP element-mobilizing transposase RayT
MDKYKNKYRIPTNRLRGYDYGANGCYFVTICTKKRGRYFGEIVAGHAVETHNCASLQKTKIAKIAEKFWQDIPIHFPFVILDEFVIMPDHIHGILFFDKSAVVETDNYPSLHGPHRNPFPQQWQPNTFGRQSQNLGSVIRGFKSSLKRYANENNIDFAWQTRYYDSIIHNDIELKKVREYILNNPKNWANDNGL